MDKVCRDCRQAKSLLEFQPRPSRGTYHSRCRPCYRAYYRTYDRARPRRNRVPNKARQKDWRLRKHYGISLEEYEMLVELQAGRCAICRDVPAESLRVDHCHRTGRLRGLLCHNCNVLLGHAKDTIPRLLEAATYLKMREAV